MAQKTTSTTESTTEDIEEEDESPTIFGLLRERISGLFGGIYGLIRAVFKLLMAILIIWFVIFLLSKDFYPVRWDRVDVNDLESDINYVQISDEELRLHFRLRDVLSGMSYQGMTMLGSDAKEFAATFLPVDFDADVDSIEFNWDAKVVTVHYETQMGMDVTLEFESGHVIKTTEKRPGFWTGNAVKMIRWYAWDCFFKGYPRYRYSRDVIRDSNDPLGGYRGTNLLIQRQMIRRRPLERVLSFGARVFSLFRNNTSE